jgi:hypothetical protein
MPVTILGITLGGETAKKKAAASAYAIKYPISGDVNGLRQNLGKATIELTNLKAEAPELAADKRTQQRNITALTTQTINLQNAINDASLGMGNVSNNFTLKLPSISSLLNKSPYAPADTTSQPLVQQNIKKTKVVDGLDQKTTTTQEQVVDNTDGGQPQVGTQPQGASGNYPPPQGVQGTNYGKWIGIGALVAGIGTLGYVFFKKDK